MNVLTLANMVWFGRFGPGPYGGFGPWRLGSLILWLVLVGLLVALLVSLLRRHEPFTRAPGGARDVGIGPAPSPLDVAKMRYVRGELTKEEFEALKKDLE